ncbi:MAG: diguanylate cyclase [Rhodospirillales bacterium]|nr:diguanylate cyclase [Rhodospirillales bacterium]
MAPLLDSLDIAICLFDAQDRTVSWNATFLKFFPEHAGHVYSGEPYAENLRRFYTARLTGAECGELERYVTDGLHRHRHQSRPFAFVHRGRRLTVSSSRMPGGDRLRVWRAVADSVPLPAAALPNGGGFPIDLLESLADGATIVDESDRIVAANAAFRSLYDVPPDETVVGLTLVEVVERAWSRASLPSENAVAAMRDNIRFVGAPFELELPGDRWRRVIAQRQQQGAYVSHSDITPLKQALLELSQIAVTDPLTGLLNRRSFETTLEETCRRARRTGTPLSLMLLDIDRFKTVNDNHGHAAGDACLRRIGGFIDAATRRRTDHAARLGGDEFVILLADTDPGSALAIAETIRANCEAEPWASLTPSLPAITLSIGLCSVPAAGEVSSSQLLQKADAMLYRAKHCGRNQVQACLMPDRTGGVVA